MIHVFLQLHHKYMFIHKLKLLKLITILQVFVCMAYEASFYYWWRDTTDIPSDATGVKTNKLTLHSISPLDSGHYQCVAENEHGETYSNYAMLTVIGKNQDENKSYIKLISNLKHQKGYEKLELGTKFQVIH